MNPVELFGTLSHFLKNSKSDHSLDLVFSTFKYFNLSVPMSSTSSSSTTSSSTTSSDTDTNDLQSSLPLSDLRRKINRDKNSRTNQKRYYPHEVMTIHAELSSEPDQPCLHPGPAKKPKPNDYLYDGKFWNNSSLVPSVKTRHSISKIINSKNKKIALLEYNLSKKDKLIQSKSKDGCH